MKRLAFFALLVGFAAVLSPGLAQMGAPGAGPATLPAGWEQIDQRFVFLTVRLSSAEASLQAVNRAIKATGYQQTAKRTDAENYRKGNEMMDRKGGGPVRWDEFYGRSAEKFFYHPTDPNTTYHTRTTLTQKEPRGTQRPGDVAPSQGVPVSQRPPQFDYIYRANVDAQRNAEQQAAALGGKIDKLLQRRRQLEAEQSALWCQIAFQAVASREFSARPLYRFNMKAADGDPRAPERLEAAKAACEFVWATDRLMAEAQRAVELNQGQVYELMLAVVSPARKTLIDRLSQQESLGADVQNPQTTLGRVTACAKRLDDLARNIIDSYRLAAESDQAGDDLRKDTVRGLLQENLISMAETLFTMDQCVSDLTREWKLKPDVNTSAAATGRQPLAIPPVPARQVPAPAEPQPAVAAPPQASAPAAAPLPQPAKAETPAVQQNDGWFVLFRSANPSIWDTGTHKGVDVFAVPLSAAPQGVLYLKLAKPDGMCVIIPMTQEQLRSKEPPGTGKACGWVGTALATQGRDAADLSYSLGITSRGIPTDESVMSRMGADRYSGWGFGHKKGRLGRQAFIWNGLDLGPTVFEISVKTTPLTEEEKKSLKE